MADSEASPQRPAADGASPPAPRTPPEPHRDGHTTDERTADEHVPDRRADDEHAPDRRAADERAADERATRVLIEEIATVQHELARIDGKAATLAALAGAGIAFLVTQLGPGTPIVSGVLLGLAITALTTAVLILLRLLRPLHGGNGGFWSHAGHPSVDALRHWAEQADRANALAEELLALSRITATRQRHLRHAVDTLAAAVALLLATALTQLLDL